MLRRTLLALAAGLTLSIVGPADDAAARTLDAIKESGTIKVAVPQDFPPFGSVGIDLAPVGYDIDMANLIAEKLGVSVELVPVTSANRLPYLQTDRVDLVISSLGKNAEREAVIDFTTAYAPFFNGVFGPADMKIEDAAALAGHTVGVTRGSVEDLELSKVAPEGAEIKRYEDNNGTITAFLSNQVEYVATGNVVAATIREKNPPRLPEVMFLIKNSPCYIGLAKGNEALKGAVDGIIAAAKADGSLNAISQKWLQTDLPESF